MVYVGIDLHHNRSQITVLDQQGGELLSRRIVNDPHIFLELLQGGRSPSLEETTQRFPCND